MRNFILTPQHMERGLTDDDFSNYAGYRVVSFFHSDFPHWDKLARGEQLSVQETAERAGKIYEALSNKGLVTGRGGNFDFSAAQAVSTINGGGAYMDSRYYEIKSSAQRFYIETILREGFEKTDFKVKETIDGHSRSRYLVHPWASSNPELMRTVGVPREAFIMRVPPGMDARSYWGMRLEIQPELILHAPEEGGHLIREDLHEQRHLRQLKATVPAVLADFLNELDSDLFQRHVFRQAGAYPQTNEAVQHMRYMRLLRSLSDHWTALTVETVESGRNPPHFFKILGSVLEIRARVALEARVAPHHRLDSKKMQWLCLSATIGDHLDNQLVREVKQILDTYANWKDAQKPEVVFTLLRQLVQETEAFTDPVSNYISRQIVAGANYFNPGLTRESLVHTKIREPTRPQTNPGAVSSPNSSSPTDIS